MKIQIKATQEALAAFKEHMKAWVKECLVSPTWIKDLWVIEFKALADLELALVLIHQDKAITVWDVIR